MHEDTNSRLQLLSTRIWYGVDLTQARKDMFERLGDIPGLSLDDKFDVCKMIAKESDRLDIFMGLPKIASVQQQSINLLVTLSNDQSVDEGEDGDGGGEGGDGRFKVLILSNSARGLREVTTNLGFRGEGGGGFNYCS
ncbi:hypothetical protein SASPL_123441 [Salvia splendens]|uniref:Uncharacterized protein n=1 Tax=Salvia splendens TaxID=180675 RepID=A0A8X8XLF7_SALSN|nr:hypothetical protein SASPL_123441 [Salvia splendens]